MSIENNESVNDDSKYKALEEENEKLKQALNEVRFL